MPVFKQQISQGPAWDRIRVPAVTVRQPTVCVMARP